MRQASKGATTWLPGSRRVQARWPASLDLVRHAESVGNVARTRAEAHGLPVIDVAERDMDVPLSGLGDEQAQALGAWLGGLGARRPAIVLASPYLRAERTAAIAVQAASLDTPVVLDERLRERDLGALDRLTRVGVEQRFPEELAARAHLGKFYYRPPGGESWSDVALRVRSALDSIVREHSGQRVMVVTHEVVIFLFRYVLERMSEVEILRLATDHELANASVTSFVLPRGRPAGMTLEAFNAVYALAESGTRVTAEPDLPVGAR